MIPGRTRHSWAGRPPWRRCGVTAALEWILARLGAPVAIGLDEASFLAATATHPTLLVTGILPALRDEAWGRVAVRAWG